MVMVGDGLFKQGLFPYDLLQLMDIRLLVVLFNDILHKPIWFLAKASAKHTLKFVVT